MKTNLLQVFVCILTTWSTLTVQAQTEYRRPLITGVANVAFFTKDMESSRQFFKEYLGFAEPFSLIDKKGKEISHTFIKINDRQYVELLPEQHQGGNRMYHFSIETNDVEGMRKYLESKGVKVPKKTRTRRTGNSTFYITDPNGTTFEFIQYNPHSMSDKNRGKDMPNTRISTHMTHVGFMVSNLNKALSFYRDILGFKEIWRGSKDNKKVTWVNLQVPDGNNYIELVMYDKEPTEAKMGSMNHICLEVKDVSKAATTLANRTLPKECKKTTMIRTGIDKKRQINCFDLNGTRVEIMEEKTVDGKPAPSFKATSINF